MSWKYLISGGKSRSNDGLKLEVIIVLERVTALALLLNFAVCAYKHAITSVHVESFPRARRNNYVTSEEVESKGPKKGKVTIIFR